MNCWAISNHLAGQLTLDPNDDERTNGFGALPPECDNDPEAKRAWGIASMKAAKAGPLAYAQQLDEGVVQWKDEETAPAEAAKEKG